MIAFDPDNNDFTFDEIVDACYQLQDLAKLGLASSLDDLVWPSAEYCSCPSVSCDASDASGLYEWYDLVSKECYEVTCEEADSWSGLSGKFYDDNTLSETHSPWNWNLFSCSANSPMCTDGDDTYLPGDVWFADLNECELCTTFCYCDAQGVSQCVDGFANLATADDTLKDAFADRFSWDIDSVTFILFPLYTLCLLFCCIYK